MDKEQYYNVLITFFGILSLALNIFNELLAHSEKVEANSFIQYINCYFIKGCIKVTTNTNNEPITNTTNTPTIITTNPPTTITRDIPLTEITIKS